tara:strand:- start:2018 stop:2386 length:369 start_codon:yes stop_codon:yes gene_type:complete
MLQVNFNKIEHIGNSLDSVVKLEREIEEYTDILFGRQPSPMQDGISTLYELAVAYYARAKEIEMYCKKFESGIDVGKTRHPFYKFRVGQLNVFIEMTKEIIKLGSRRITLAQMMIQEREELM